MSDLISRDDAIRALNGACSNWEDDAKVQEIVMAIPSADAVSREEYEKLYHKAEEVNDMANDILSDFPSYIKAVGYVEWLEKIIVDTESFEWLCEDTNDKEWCEKNCRYDSIQAECLRHLYKAKPSAEAEPKRVLQGYCKGANTIQTIRHEELTQIANTRKAVESADAEPTVVRCKTMIPYGDFREWAKRIREDNPNVIVIPFDAEVASADAVQGEWIHDGQNFKGGLDWCHCSVCGQKTSTNGLSMYNFCPNCGARMKGGEEE